MRLAFLTEILRDRFVPGLGLQLGLDHSIAQGVKSNRPLEVSGTATVIATGEMRPAEAQTDYEYSYSYFTPSLALAYHFDKFQLIKNLKFLHPLYVICQLRLPLSGSYSEERSRTTGRGEQSSLSESGSLKGDLGFGLILGYDLNWPKGYKIGVNFMFSEDDFTLDGIKYSNTFHGFGISMEF